MDVIGKTVQKHSKDIRGPTVYTAHRLETINNISVIRNNY